MTHKPRHKDLTTGSIPRQLFNLSLPMVWGILAVVTMQVADMWFIGQLGHTQLTAISFTFPVSMAVFHLVMGLSIATSSIISRLIGKKDFEGMKHFLAHSLLIAVFIGFVLALIGTAILNPVFAVLGAGPEHMPYIRSFMTISLWGYMFVIIPMTGNAALRAGGDSLTPSLIMVGAAVINIPLSCLLVFGAGGWPGLGVAGAATANVLANICSALVGLYVLIFRAHVLDRAAFTLNGFGASAKKLLTIAIPIGLTNLAQPLVGAFLTGLLATSGAAAVAGFGIITRIEALAAVVLMALAVGMGPIIGQCYGAHAYARLRETLRIAINFAVIWSFAVYGILMIVGGAVARQFTDDPATIYIVHTYFLLTGCSMAVAAVAAGWGSAWNALGRSGLSAGLSFLRIIVAAGLFGYIGHTLNGWYGLFVGLALGNLLSGLVLHFLSVYYLDRLLRHPSPKA